MATNRIIGGLRLAAVVLGAALCACSGGGSDSPPPTDMGGHWLVFLTPPGGTTESGPNAVLLNQTGNTIDGAGIQGTVTGNNFTITANAVIFTLTMRGSIAGDSGSGTVEIEGLTGMVGSFRVQRFNPTGTVTANGTAQGQTIAIDTSAAAGGRSFLDVGLTQLDGVDVIAMQGDVQFELGFDPTGLAVGTLAVPTDVNVRVLYRGDAFSIEVDAIGGSVEVLQYDSTGLAGTFALDLPGGDAITGAFQVTFDFDSYDA